MSIEGDGRSGSCCFAARTTFWAILVIRLRKYSPGCRAFHPLISWPRVTIRQPKYVPLKFGAEPARDDAAYITPELGHLPVFPVGYDASIPDSSEILSPSAALANGAEGRFWAACIRPGGHHGTIGAAIPLRMIAQVQNPRPPAPRRARKQRMGAGSSDWPAASFAAAARDEPLATTDAQVP